ncbi:MAG: hypothetical protein NT051_04040 [Candidatus Micrarchaeota archaeon]|nr:hypothetical protein [Candidatus Micrarchaeota archaeon]
MENERDEQQDARKLYAQKMQAMQLEMQKKELMRKMLSEGAYERMMNVRLANPEVYEKIVNSLAYMAQSGKQMEGRITEEQLLSLLKKLSPTRETKIEFRSK